MLFCCLSFDVYRYVCSVVNVDTVWRTALLLWIKRRVTTVENLDIHSRNVLNLFKMVFCSFWFYHLECSTLVYYFHDSINLCAKSGVLVYHYNYLFKILVWFGTNVLLNLVCLMILSFLIHCFLINAYLQNEFGIWLCYSF